MTDASESSPATVASGTPGPTALSRAAAWVGITAGAVFIAAAVFFSGFLLSWTTDGHGNGHHMGSAAMPCCDHPGMDHHMMAPGGHM